MDVLMENAVQVVAALLLMLIGVLGTWLTAKIGTKTELTNIRIAAQELFDVVAMTVAELQQTAVEGMKAASADGKLSEEEIKLLGIRLYDGAVKKLSPAAMGVLSAAGLDLAGMIRGMGERVVMGMKK